jgi:hypothetical protein
MAYVTDEPLPDPPSYGKNVLSAELPGNETRQTKVISRGLSQEEQRSIIRNGRLKLYLVARVIYGDEFGDEHTTAICAVYSGTDGQFLKPDDCPVSYFKHT